MAEGQYILGEFFNSKVRELEGLPILDSLDATRQQLMEKIDRVQGLQPRNLKIIQFSHRFRRTLIKRSTSLKLKIGQKQKFGGRSICNIYYCHVKMLVPDV